MNLIQLLINQQKKHKDIYSVSDIKDNGHSLYTKDGMYETYSEGIFSSWKRTMMGMKNDVVDIGENIRDGYTQASFRDKNRALNILLEMIKTNKYEKNKQ